MSLGHPPVELVVGKGKQKLVVLQGGAVGSGYCFLVVKSMIPLLFVGSRICSLDVGCCWCDRGSGDNQSGYISSSEPVIVL